MLRNIHLHISEDENEQAKLEQKLAEHITKTHKSNVNAFKRHIPTLIEYLQVIERKNIAVFCNKFSEYNIVDFGTGKTFYGFHPLEEVSEQVRLFCQRPQYASFNEKAPRYSNDKTFTTNIDKPLLGASPKLNQLSKATAITEKAECIVVLGCGLGHHVEQLISQLDIEHMIIYEAEPQYFSNSASVLDWRGILDESKQKGTRLYVQIGHDGRRLVSDIEELRSHFNISGFYVYKHYNHPIYDALSEQLSNHSWQELVERGIHFEAKDTADRYCPPWLPTVDLTSKQLCSNTNEKFQKNLSAFQTYFPDIYEQFKNYKPQYWLPINNTDNEINILERERLVAWYSKHPKNDCLINYESFKKHPLKDGLVLGYKGKKLAHYIHNQFVKETEELIEKVREESGLLPEKIKSIIIFGLGVGYHLEELLDSHTVENLFICEPNRDFFYASLFAIDWSAILEEVDKSEHRIYINIGDDGTNLFRDLLSQFHVIGPYILNNTYFYQSYYNAALNTAISQLREQLKVVIAMGENFDHAYYGIAHTLAGLERNYPLLIDSPSKSMKLQEKETPVFLIGNGPSLDHSITYIKEHHEDAILVSCGTSLHTLYKKGIIPDFHAEIEQNRATYDWPSLIGDKNYLKNISLVSCNGIHPDTAELYRDVFIAFKEGESSTVSALEILGRANFEVLEDSFPTVVNFATNLFSTLGFQSIYFIGVDLGFIDKKHHHSKLSSYYLSSGEELYDYAKASNTSIQIAGNFRPFVNTKHEFKISKEMLEHTILKSKKSTTYYNCSNGAKIMGALPLPLEDILISADESNKLTSIKSIKSNAFTTPKECSAAVLFNNKFDKEVLRQEFVKFEELVDTELKDINDAENLIKRQKEFLLDSYNKGNSLLFYYLYGTLNYANAVLSKLIHTVENNGSKENSFKIAVAAWKNKIKQISKLTAVGVSIFDSSQFREYQREEQLLSQYVKSKSLLVITDSQGVVDSVNWVVKNQLPWGVSVTTCSQDCIPIAGETTFDFVIYNLMNPAVEPELNVPIHGKLSTLYAIYRDQYKDVRHFYKKNPNITFFPLMVEKNVSVNGDCFNDLLTMSGGIIRSCFLTSDCPIILPKYVLKEGYDTHSFDQALFSIIDTDAVFDYGLYLFVYPVPPSQINVLASGTRGRLILDTPTYKNHVQLEYDSKIFSSEVSRVLTCVPSINSNSKYQGCHRNT